MLLCRPAGVLLLGPTAGAKVRDCMTHCQGLLQPVLAAIDRRPAPPLDTYSKHTTTCDSVSHYWRQDCGCGAGAVHGDSGAGTGALCKHSPGRTHSRMCLCRGWFCVERCVVWRGVCVEPVVGGVRGGGGLLLYVVVGMGWVLGAGRAPKG